MKTLKPIRTERDCRAALRDLGAIPILPPRRAGLLRSFGATGTQLRNQTPYCFAAPPTLILHGLIFSFAIFAKTNFGLCYEINELTKITYEILNGKRPLSLAMIRRLHDKLGIPADVLIQA